MSKNHNIFQPANFHLVFPTAYDELNDYVLNISTPDILLGHTSAFPSNNSHVPYPGDELVPSDIAVSFILDENFRAYSIIWDWLIDIKHNVKVKAEAIDILHDIRIIAYDSQQKETVAEWVLGDAYPIGLPPLIFNHNENSVEATSFNVFFKYFFLEYNNIRPTTDIYI